MPIDSSEILMVAKYCIGMNNEAGYRSAISRAYYSLYLKVCEILMNCPKKSHYKVVDYLLSGGDEENIDSESLKVIGKTLRQKKNKRVRADYALHKNIAAEDAISSFAVVQKMLLCLQEIEQNKAK